MTSSRWFKSCLSSSYASSLHLTCIAALKKLCNHPALLYRETREEHVERQSMTDNVRHWLKRGVPPPIAGVIWLFRYTFNVSQGGTHNLSGEFSRNRPGLFDCVNQVSTRLTVGGLTTRLSWNAFKVFVQCGVWSESKKTNVQANCARVTTDSLFWSAY